MRSVQIFGIKACDTMKKAFSWLDERGVAYNFRDYKKEGVTEAALSRWSDAAGWERILNRAGTTFRKLPEAERRDLTREKAIALMIANPSMIKRPILEAGNALEIGFKPEAYAILFGN